MKDFGFARVSLQGFNIYSESDVTISGLYSRLSTAYDMGYPILLTDITNGSEALPPVLPVIEKTVITEDETNVNVFAFSLIPPMEGFLPYFVTPEDTLKVSG